MNVAYLLTSARVSFQSRGTRYSLSAVTASLSKSSNVLALETDSKNSTTEVASPVIRRVALARRRRSTLGSSASANCSALTKNFSYTCLARASASRYSGPSVVIAAARAAMPREPPPSAGTSPTGVFVVSLARSFVDVDLSMTSESRSYSSDSFFNACTAPSFRSNLAMSTIFFPIPDSTRSKQP